MQLFHYIWDVKWFIYLGENPLINHTKTILANAFEELLQTKSFDEITVTDIVKHCGAARSTFYKYFSDKYDVMIWKYENASKPYGSCRIIMWLYAGFAQKIFWITFEWAVSFYKKDKTDCP